MQRRSFVLKLKSGMKDEYIRRHKSIWPEMAAMLKSAGISNYSIWWHDDSIFGYYESEDLAKTDEFKRLSPVQARWNEYMKDIISSDGDAPEMVFYLA